MVLVYGSGLWFWFMILVYGILVYGSGPWYSGLPFSAVDNNNDGDNDDHSHGGHTHKYVQEEANICLFLGSTLRRWNILCPCCTIQGGVRWKHFHSEAKNL